jgi:hypothetical protein
LQISFSIQESGKTGFLLLYTAVAVTPIEKKIAAEVRVHAGSYVL